MAMNSLLAKQVSGHDFSHAVKAERSVAFRPCFPQGLKPAFIESLSARVNSCPDTCRIASCVPHISQRQTQ